jgi:hypothetical protein
VSDSHNYTGLVVGGPLDGKSLTNNASKGFVAVDFLTNQASVYDYSPNSATFVHQYDAPVDEEKLGKAQEDGARSVLALNYPQSGEAEDIASFTDEDGDIPEWEPEAEDG